VGIEVHACNSSYIGGEEEDCSLKLDQAKTEDLMGKITKTERGLRGVA
jgi:hypothetical protein